MSAAASDSNLARYFTNVVIIRAFLKLGTSQGTMPACRAPLPAPGPSPPSNQPPHPHLTPFRLTGIGVGLGLAFAWVLGYVLKLLRWRGARPYIESLVVLATAYLTFYVAQAGCSLATLSPCRQGGAAVGSTGRSLVRRMAD